MKAATAAVSTDDPQPVEDAGAVLTRAGTLQWGLQFFLLNPAVALLLVVEVYGASAAQVGTVLVVYNSVALVAVKLTRFGGHRLAADRSGRGGNSVRCLEGSW